MEGLLATLLMGKGIQSPFLSSEGDIFPTADPHCRSWYRTLVGLMKNDCYFTYMYKISS